MKVLLFAMGVLLAAAAMAQMPPSDDELMRKQVQMLAAEAQYFAALAQRQQGELEKLKAAPCEPK